MVDSGVELIGDLSLIKLKQLIKWSIEKVDESLLTDDFLKDVRERLKDMEFQNAMQVLGGELSPQRKYVKGEDKLTVVHIATLDDGFKDNVIHHYCINGDKCLSIKERGVKDLLFGDVVTFECTTSTLEDSDITYYDVKKGTTPQVVRRLSIDETFEKMRSVKKAVCDLEHGEVAVVELRMTHYAHLMKNKGEELPAWVMNDQEEGFQVMVNAYQRRDEEAEDSEGDDITLFLRPQRYGKQEYTGLIPENYADDVMKYLAPEDYLEQVINMFVPRPTSLKVLSMGKVRVDNREGKYKGSKSFSPCIGIMLDAKSQTPDFLTADDPEPEEEPEPVEEAGPEPNHEEAMGGDDTENLTPAPFEAVKKYIKYNPTITFEKISNMLAKKTIKIEGEEVTGFSVDEETFEKAKKEMGV